MWQVSEAITNTRKGGFRGPGGHPGGWGARHFGLFGTEPLHGRWPGPEDDRPGAPRVAVLNYPFWRRHFGADPGVVGETVYLEGDDPYTVVGVAPRGFQGQGLAMALYTPLVHWSDVAVGLDERAVGTVDLLGRLAPGVSREAAEEALAALARGIDEAVPRDSPRKPELTPLAGPEAAWDDPMTGRAKILMGVVGLFLFLAAVIATLVFSTAPVLEVLRRDLVAPLRSDAAGGAPGGAGGPRRALVVVQVAVATALLVGAGLLVRSSWTLGREDVGFDRDNLYLATVYVPDDGADFGATTGLYRELAERAGALPGIAAAGLVARPPLFGGSFEEPLLVPGRPGGDEPVDVHTNLVGPGYFGALGVPVVQGRAFTEGDRAGAPNVVVVNETAARRLWPERSPLGRSVAIARSGRAEERGQRFEGVGVVADHRYGGPRFEPGPLVYFPVAQRPRPRLTVMLRSERPASWLGASFRDLLRDDFPDLALIELAPLEDQLRRSFFEERLNTGVATAVGVLSLLLAGLGLASLMAFQVSRRRREIAVRMAVGAAPADAVALVMRSAAILVAVGLGVGLAAAAGLGRLLESLLYGVAPHDPVAIAAVLATLAATALAATWLPARRAARVDPASTLRGD